jgi:hypothetical protein
MRTTFRAALLCAALIPAAIPASAAGDDLYRAVVFVTGQGEENRGAAFATGFREVLAKVSGDARLLADMAVAPLAEKAADTVVGFSYRDLMEGNPVHDEQGTRQRPYDLTVAFSPAAIDHTLGDLGRKPWTGSRPTVAVIAGVTNDPLRYVLTQDGGHGRDLRDALAVAGERVGLAVALPSEAALARARLDADNLAEAEPAKLGALATAAGGDLAAVGALTWSDAALGWTATWRFETGGHTYAWTIAGVSFDAAFRSALRGVAQVMSGNGAPQ